MIHKVGAKPSPATQTVIIWDELNADLTFFVLKGDLTKLNKVYINSADGDEKLMDELNETIYVKETGHYANEELSEFPVNAVLNGAAVIVAGFLP